MIRASPARESRLPRSGLDWIGIANCLRAKRDAHGQQESARSATRVYAHVQLGNQEAGSGALTGLRRRARREAAGRSVTDEIGLGPWIVYMAIDDGAILIVSPEDAVTSWDREAVGLNRTPHVTGRGATKEHAEADARRELRRRGGPTNSPF